MDQAFPSGGGAPSLFPRWGRGSGPCPLFPWLISGPWLQMWMQPAPHLVGIWHFWAVTNMAAPCADLRTGFPKVVSTNRNPKLGDSEEGNCIQCKAAQLSYSTAARQPWSQAPLQLESSTLLQSMPDCSGPCWSARETVFGPPWKGKESVLPKP